MKAKQKTLSNLRVKQQALYIMIFSFVTVVIWITVSLLSSQKKTGIAPDLLELAKPLSPTINVGLIDNIENSTAYSDQELSNFQIYKIIRSKDGRQQQVVPIDSNLDVIPENQQQIIIQEQSQFNQEEAPADTQGELPTPQGVPVNTQTESSNPQDRLSNQTNLEEQVDAGQGIFVPQLEELN